MIGGTASAQPIGGVYEVVHTILHKGEQLTLLDGDALVGTHDRYDDSILFVVLRPAPVAAPEPKFRSGAIMACGCWYDAMPGSVEGVTMDVCPLHGKTLMAKANIKESVANGSGVWSQSTMGNRAKGEGRE